MATLRMRLVPEDYAYSKTFHVLFSALSKSIKKSAQFYTELANIRRRIKENGAEAVLEAMSGEDVLSPNAREYFDKMRPELPKVGVELSSRTVCYLLSMPK